MGCGPGALAAALAGVLGASHVAAVDPSEPFARACASRVEGVRVDPSAADLDEGRSMPHCRPDELEELWRAAGLHDVETSELVVEAGYRDFGDLWQPLESGVGPSGAYAAGLPPERQARLREELRRRLDAGDGPFRLTARAWSVVGHVP